MSAFRISSIPGLFVLPLAFSVLICGCATVPAPDSATVAAAAVAATAAAEAASGNAAHGANGAAPPGSPQARNGPTAPAVAPNKMPPLFPTSRAFDTTP